MITTTEFRGLAQSLPEAVELAHFGRTSFRVKKRIFATLAEDTGVATLKFSLEDQVLFCAMKNSAIYPVPNKWGRLGWTFIDLKKVPKGLVLDALNIAYQSVLKSKSWKKR